VTAVRVIGVDPGPTPGIVMLRWDLEDGGRMETPIVVQCNFDFAHHVLDRLLGAYAGATIVQCERFVIGRKSMRAGAAGEATSTLIGELREVWEENDSTPNGRLGGRWFERSASQIKPWATDGRLAAAGLLLPTTGMRHARDAARHALFAAVHDGKIPDPLSKRAR